MGHYYLNLLYKQKGLSGKYTTREVYTKLHLGPEWRIFHILTSGKKQYFTTRK